MVVAVPKPRITRWYVDTDGRRLGPFTLGQLQTEFRAGRVRAEDAATPVNETGMPDGQVRMVKQLLDQFLDPAVSLFETLRAAKDKRAPQKKHWSIPDTPRETPRSVFKKIPDQAWLFGGLAVVTGLLIMISITFIRESGRMLTRQSDTPRPLSATPTQPPVIPTQARPAAVSKPLITPILPAPVPIARRPIPRPVPPPVRREDPRDDRKDDRRDDRRDDLPMDRDIASPKSLGFEEIHNGPPEQRPEDPSQNADPRDARDPRDAGAYPVDPGTLRDNAPTQ